MIYLLTCGLFILGVCFHVMQKIGSLRIKFPELDAVTVFNTFFKQEWDSLLVSALVLACIEVFIFLTRTNQYTLPSWFAQWGIYGFSLVMGYAGQRLAYKYLQTAESVLEKKVDNLKDR
jgi:hypothetical protein